MTEQEIKTLMTLARKVPRDFAMLKLMASTGLRIGDIVRLLRAQLIDSDRDIVRVLRVRMGKTGRWIERPMREDARSAVRDYLATRSDRHPWLFLSQSIRTKYHMPGPLTRSAAHKIVKKYLALIYPASLIQGTSTHVLRRSIAKLINRKTGRIETAQEWLGHTNPANTVSYIDAEEYREKANTVVASLDI